MVVVGIDLAGVETRPTGFCILREKSFETSIVYTDEEIIKKVASINPDVVAIDAPLSLPRGRKSIDERTNIHLRGCDRELLRRGIKFLPITLGAMRKLTKRGMELKRILEKNHKVIEVYPGGAQDIWSIERNGTGLRTGLRKLGFKLNSNITDHEMDALTCAIVGRLFLEGKIDIYGNSIEGTIIMPKTSKKMKGKGRTKTKK